MRRASERLAHLNPSYSIDGSSIRPSGRKSNERPSMLPQHLDRLTTGAGDGEQGKLQPKRH